MNLIKILYFNDFWDIYYLFLLISVRAFLPSLRVLKTSQDREEKIIMLRAIKEIWIV